MTDLAARKVEQTLRCRSTPAGRLRWNAYMREYRRAPEKRLLHSLRSRLHGALNGRYKAGSTVELLGCTPAQARDHIESTWQSGWTWTNYGTVWEVDHVRSCARFDLSDPAQQRECFNWRNMRAYAVGLNRAEKAR